MTAGGTGIRALLRAKRREEAYDRREARRLGTAVRSTRVDMGLPRGAAAPDRPIFSRRSGSRRRPATTAGRGGDEQEGGFRRMGAGGLAWPPSVSLGLLPAPAAAAGAGVAGSELLGSARQQLAETPGLRGAGGGVGDGARIGSDSVGMGPGDFLEMSVLGAGRQREAQGGDAGAEGLRTRITEAQGSPPGLAQAATPRMDGEKAPAPPPAPESKRNSQQEEEEGGSTELQAGDEHGATILGESRPRRPRSAPAMRRFSARGLLELEREIVPSPTFGAAQAPAAGSPTGSGPAGGERLHDVREEPQPPLAPEGSELEHLTRLTKPFPSPKHTGGGSPTRGTRSGAASPMSPAGLAAAAEASRAMHEELGMALPEVPDAREHARELHEVVERSQQQLAITLQQMDLALARRAKRATAEGGIGGAGRGGSVSGSGSGSAGEQDTEPDRFVMRSSPLRGRIRGRPLSASAGRVRGSILRVTGPAPSRSREAASGSGEAKQRADKDMGSTGQSTGPAGTEPGVREGKRPGSAVLRVEEQARESARMRRTLGMPGPHPAIAAMGTGSGATQQDLWGVSSLTVRRAVASGDVKMTDSDRDEEDPRPAAALSPPSLSPSSSPQRAGRGGRKPGGTPALARSPVRTPSQRRRAAHLRAGARIPPGLVLEPEPSRGMPPISSGRTMHRSQSAAGLGGRRGQGHEKGGFAGGRRPGAGPVAAWGAGGGVGGASGG